MNAESIAAPDRSEMLARFAAARTIHALIEHQAARNPQAVAIESAKECVTYETLNARANRLAHWLIEEGVGPEKIVAILMERDVDAIVAILAVLKAGGAWLPLDPAYPLERQEYIVRDAGAMLVIASAASAAELVTTPGVRVMDFHAVERLLPGYDTHDPAVAVEPQHLCYVIYTSGSTGNPKGVMVEHRNLLFSMRARIEYYRHPPAAVALLFSLAFDGSVVGIFWALCEGARLVLPTPEAGRDPVLLAAEVERRRVSHLLALPTMYGLLLEQGQPRQLESLRLVIVAGEECPPKIVRAHAATLPATGLYNEYGPTETTIWCTVCAVTGEAGGRIPIGKPIPGSRVYVLQGDIQAPAGEQGEICVAGPGVTRGYLNRPDLTQERFVSDPVHGAAGERLYRTGDLGRWRSDGHLEFLGRIDHQVKIRGFRIEPGEVEMRFREHRLVQDCAVVARTSGEGAWRLVAYVVLRSSEGGAAARLREDLRGVLPEYMVPSRIVPLAELPKLPSGKIDRNALPDPDSVLQVREDWTPPVGELESMLARLWEELLGVSPIGREDDFLELGGHSLLVTRLVWRIRQALDVEVPVRILFEAPVLRDFAARVETTQLLARASSPTAGSEEIVF